VKRGGGNYDRVKEGASIGVALWRGREAVRRERRRRRSCQLSEGGREGGEGARGLVGRLNLLGHSGPKGQMGRLATGSKVEENFFSGKN
jgi:hypothetical protein